MVNFGSNDYLGLAADGPRQAVVQTIEQAGWGSGASPLVTGRGTVHAALEQALARFEGTESALLFPSGYAANLGTIAALVGRGDAVYVDAKNHASIIDGCRLSGARLEVYPHGDVGFLQKRLARRGDFRRRLIVTDTLFSMDGDLAPLPDLAELAERYDAMLMVDEAHATGVFGPSGRGVCEQLGVERGVHVRVGTLSKALGSMGGFVAGSAQLIDWLANRARSYVFSTAPPEAMAAYALETLRTVIDEPFRRTVLLQRAARLRAGSAAPGLEHGHFREPDRARDSGRCGADDEPGPNPSGARALRSRHPPALRAQGRMPAAREPELSAQRRSGAAFAQRPGHRNPKRSERGTATGRRRQASRPL